MLRSLRRIGVAAARASNAAAAPVGAVAVAPLPAATTLRAPTARAAPFAGSSVRHLTSLRSGAIVAPSTSSCSVLSSCRCCAATSAPRTAALPAAAAPSPRAPHRGFSTLESVGGALSGGVGAGIPASDDPHARFVVLYTCKVCETRAAKSVSRQAYSEGVVLLRCDGCDKLHLFADHLGWFDDERVDIETIMAEKGLKVGRSSLDLGKEQLDQLELLQRNMRAQAEANKARAEAAAAAAAATTGTNPAAAGETHAAHEQAHGHGHGHKSAIDAEDAVLEPAARKKTTSRKKTH